MAPLHHKRILLISNKVMHYRVSVYNYFTEHFRNMGWKFAVLSDTFQIQNTRPPEFEYYKLPLTFNNCKTVIDQFDPSAVILFLHLKDLAIWPLLHWLKVKRVPFAFWTKGGNWDNPGSKLRYQLFNYVHSISDALILYAPECLEFLKPVNRTKAFIAPNTINFYDFPNIAETKEEIKKEFSIPFSKVVLFAGRMDEGRGRKKVEHLVEIFSSFPRADIGLIIVGAGMSPENQKRLDGGNIRYLGEVHDPENIQISKIFKMSDVCAIPGHVGLGLHQAFFWGLPVVTEHGMHPPEIRHLKAGINGFIVPQNDLASLKDHIIYLLDNDDIRARFSDHARDEILNHASIEQMFRGFKDCLHYLSK